MTALELLAAFGDVAVVAVAGVLWYHVRECNERADDVIEQRRKQWLEHSWQGRCIERIAASLNIQLPEKPSA